MEVEGSAASQESTKKRQRIEVENNQTIKKVK